MGYKNAEEILHLVNKIKETYKTFTKYVILHQKTIANEVVGVLYYWVIDDIYTIDTIFANESHRKIDIAKELIDKSIKESKEKQCK